MSIGSWLNKDIRKTGSGLGVFPGRPGPGPYTSSSPYGDPPPTPIQQGGVYFDPNNPNVIPHTTLNQGGGLNQEGVNPSAPGGGAQWDESGFPVGPMPRGAYALDWQYEANRRAEQRRMALWNDAQNTMRQGLDLFQSYRPGGSAALASGMYGQKASLYGTQAMNTEAPDLLMAYRERKQDEADAERKQAERFARTMAIAQLAAGIAGGAAGYQAVGAAGNLVNPTGGGQPAPAAVGQDQSGAGGAGGGGVIPMPAGGSPAAQQMAAQGGGVPAMQPSYGTPGAPQALQAGGGAGGGGQGYGAPAGVQGGRRAAGAAGGGYDDSPAGGGGLGGWRGVGSGGTLGAGPAPGNPGGLQTFAPPEPAALAMAASPVTQMSVYTDWAEDRLRRSGVAMQLRGARKRLIQALDSAYYGEGVLDEPRSWSQELQRSGRY